MNTRQTEPGITPRRWSRSQQVTVRSNSKAMMITVKASDSVV